MLYFRTGVPGSGKSYSALESILEELLKPDGRHVYTNLFVDRPKLRKYLFDRGFEHVDAHLRLHSISHEEVPTFWRYRPTGNLTIALSDRGLPDHTVWSSLNPIPPCLYVIDEAQVCFGSRNWARVGNACREYISQHRHFGDDIVCLSPHPKLVDADFTRLSESFSVFENRGRRLIFGVIRRGNLTEFSRSVYSSVPTGAVGERPDSTDVLKLDPAKASLYSTAAVNSGSSNSSGSADTTNKARGISLRWIITAAIILLVGFWYVGPGRVVSWVSGQAKSFVGLGSKDKKPGAPPTPAAAPTNSISFAQSTPTTNGHLYLPQELPPALPSPYTTTPVGSKVSYPGNSDILSPSIDDWIVGRIFMPAGYHSIYTYQGLSFRVYPRDIHQDSRWDFVFRDTDTGRLRHLGSIDQGAVVSKRFPVATPPIPVAPVPVLPPSSPQSPGPSMDIAGGFGKVFDKIMQ